MDRPPDQTLEVEPRATMVAGALVAARATMQEAVSVDMVTLVMQPWLVKREDAREVSQIVNE